MANLDAQRAPAKRQWPWSGLLEDRFTNVDIVMLAAAVLLTGFIGMLSGAAMAH